MTTHCGKDRTYYQHSRAGELTLSEVTADLQNNVGRIAQGLHCGDAVPQHREQPLLQFRPYEIPRLSLSHARGCREDVRVRINQTGQRRLAFAVDQHATRSRRHRDLGDLAAIDDNGSLFDLFPACENADVRDDQKSFCAYAVTESPERARAAISVRYTLYLLEDLAPQLTVSINCVILVSSRLESKKSEAAQILL